MNVCLTSSPARRRLLLRAVVGAAALHAPLAALAGFNFFTSEYTASHDELQAQIVKRFPVRQRYAELFTVTLRDPRLSLDATANRAAISALATIESPLMSPSSVDGALVVSSALRYDAAALAVRLDQPKADRLVLQGMSGREAERLQQIGGLVAQELLRDYALIVFKPEQLTVGRKTYRIGQITVETDGIRVELQ
jgi:hypothetical protein